MEQLYDLRARRIYLTEPERNRFLKAARSTDTPIRALCEVLAFTGCRVSEALALTPERVDPAAGFLVFESLKKFRRGVFRTVPVPSGLLETLARQQLRNARNGLTGRSRTSKASLPLRNSSLDRTCPSIREVCRPPGERANSQSRPSVAKRSFPAGPP